MLKKVEIYNPEKTYMLPNLELGTPERIQMEFSAVNAFKCVVITDEAGEMFYEIHSFNDIKNRYGIDSTLSDEEVIAQLTEIINTPPIMNLEPSAEERIASAMEYQNLIMS